MYNPYDTKRMLIKDDNNIPDNYNTNLMSEYNISLNFHEYKSIKDIFISKSKKSLYFPKFNLEQSNYKCLLQSEFDTFLLILQNIKPDLIYLNDSIHIHLKSNSEMFLPKINIINNKVLPKLIIIPIDIKFYSKDIQVGGHKNVIIINTLLKTVTFFEPYGVDLQNINSAVIFNIIKDYYSEILSNFTFIDAISPNTEYTMDIDEMDVDSTFNDKFNNYYIKIDKYNNELNKVSINDKNKKQIIKEIKKLRKKISKKKYEMKKNEMKKSTVFVQNEQFSTYGPQKRQEFIENFGDMGGHCVGWSLYLVFLTFINVNLFQSSFMKNISISSFINNLLLEKINGESLRPELLSNLIREFISYVLEFNKNFKKLIIKKAKSSNVIHINFNSYGEYKIIPPVIIKGKVSNKRLDLLDSKIQLPNVYTTTFQKS